MMHAASMAPTASSLRLERSAFVPPGSGHGRLRGWLLALLGHGLLAAALFWTVRTPILTDAPAPVVQAELWDQAIEPLPPSELPPPTSRPLREEVQEVQKTQDAEREADIALEEKRRQEKLEQQHLEQQRLERLAQEREAREAREKQAAEQKAAEERAAEQARREAEEAAEKAERLAAEKAAAEKAAAEKAAAEKAAAEKAAEQKRQEQARQEKARQDEEARQAAEQRRLENIRRMQDMAGSGGATQGSAGSPSPSTRPSDGYAGRVKARILPNIVYPETISGNPLTVVRVRVAPDGTIISATISRRSGTPSWDAAVLRALQKTATLPRDRDGSVPAEMLLEFRPRG